MSQTPTSVTVEAINSGNYKGTYSQWVKENKEPGFAQEHLKDLSEWETLMNTEGATLQWGWG